MGAAGAYVDLPFDRRRGEARALARDRQDLHVIELPAQRCDLPVAMRNGDVVAGLQQLETRSPVRKRHELRKVGEAQPIAAEQDLERIAALHEQVERYGQGLDDDRRRTLGGGWWWRDRGD